VTTPTFAELGVPLAIEQVLQRSGVTSPFPIQTATIANALAGRDLCGRAPTGSGKTLAFSIPTAIRVSKAEPGRPTALILTPTRELANQVMETIKPLAQVRKRWAASFYGGTSVGRDVNRLRRGVDIAVCTPGRLVDLIQQGEFSLADCRIVVIDEADRMADMGFLPEVKRILDQTPDDRQTLLFSATLDGDVDVLIRRYQRNPVRHEVETAAGARGDVRHLFWGVDRMERRDMTRMILQRVEPAIVFTRTKRGADRLAKQLTADGISTAAIHGDRSQGQRERALAEFARGDVSTLVATDVAARGIHVDGVGVVVHYDLPGSDKDYVHRSGRTGRAGATGVVVTLVPHDQRKDFDILQRDLRDELDNLGHGLHDVDFDHLTTDEDIPAPSAPSHTHRPKPARNADRARARTGGTGSGGVGSKGDTVAVAEPRRKPFRPGSNAGSNGGSNAGSNTGGRSTNGSGSGAAGRTGSGAGHRTGNGGAGKRAGNGGARRRG